MDWTLTLPNAKCYGYSLKRHRLEGPAIEWNNGDKEWYYHGEKINCKSQAEFERIIRLKLLW